MNLFERILIKTYRNKLEKLYEWLACAVVSQAIDINSEAYNKIQTLLDEAWKIVEQVEEEKC